MATSDSDACSLSSVSSGLCNFGGNCNYRFLSYEIVPGYQINSNLLFTKDEKQFYYFSKENKYDDGYKCIEDNCPGRTNVRRDDKMCTQKVKYSTHTHGAQEEKYAEYKVLNMIKRKCTDLSTLLNERKQSARDIFYSVANNYPNFKIKFFDVERGLQVLRSAALPKNPTNADEIAKMFQRDDIAKLLGTTKDGRPFYNGVFESDDFSFCVFSSESTIKQYCERVKYGDRHIMMDGTFAVVPIGSFNQLLIIYAVYLEKVKSKPLVLFVSISFNYFDYFKSRCSQSHLF